MSVTIEQEANGQRVLRITGLLTKGELDAALNTEVKHWTPQTCIRVLIVADGFEGWERGADWGDVSFLAQHNDQIIRIAVVAEPKWETELLMFTGAGLRRAAVRFFPSEQQALARTWLSEHDE